MAKIVLPTTTPYSPNVQSPRLSTAPTSEETFANLVGQVSDKLMNFALKERERQDQLTLAENPLKESIIESYKENFDSTVFNEDGSINYEQSLLRSENILESRDVLYDKAKADVVRKYQELGLSRRVFEGVQSSVIGAFKENDESIRQSVLQQQDALKVGYVDKLKLDFTEDPSADIETSLGKMLGVIESMTVEEEKSKQRAEFIQFARSSIVEKTATFDGALQIVGGFESDALNKAVKDVRGVNLSFATIKNEITSGINKEELSDAEQDFIPIDDAAFEAFKLFSLQLPDNHPNKIRSETIVNIFQDDLNRQEGLEEINFLIQEGRIQEATQRGKLMSATLQGAYFDKLMANMSAADSNQVKAFSDIINYFIDLNQTLPKPILERVENFITSASFPTQSEQVLMRSLYGKKDDLFLGKNAEDILRRFDDRFEEDGKPVFKPTPQKTGARKTDLTDQIATAIVTDESIDSLFLSMNNKDNGDEMLSLLPIWINGNEDTFIEDKATAKDFLEGRVSEYLADGQGEPDAFSNAQNDFKRNNLFVTINGKMRLLSNYRLENLLDYKGNKVSRESFSQRFEQELRNEIVKTGVQTEEAINEKLDEITSSGYKFTGGSGGIIFVSGPDNPLVLRIDANKIAKDFASNSYFVDSSTLINLFDETPELLNTNATQALQVLMPSGKRQVQSANLYLGYLDRKLRKSGEFFVDHEESDLQYYVDNYPFKLEDPDFLKFIEGLPPLQQIEVLRARTEDIVGMSRADKFIAHPYTRDMLAENFDASLMAFRDKDPANAFEKLVESRIERGEPVGFFEQGFAVFQDFVESNFDLVAEFTNLKYDQSDLDEIHQEITEAINAGTTANLSSRGRTVFASLSMQALAMTKETYQLQVNSLTTDEERKAFFNEKIRNPIPLDNYRFSGLTDPSKAIMALKSKETDISDEDRVQRAFNMMRKAKAENPGESFPNSLNVFLGAESYLRSGDLKSTAEGMVFEKDLPFNVRGGRNILNYIKQENPGLDEKQIVDLFRFDLAGYFEKTGVNPEYAFAFDKSSLLKILDSLGSNDE